MRTWKVFVLEPTPKSCLLYTSDLEEIELDESDEVDESEYDLEDDFN